MMILANLVALALVTGDLPTPPTAAPTAMPRISRPRSGNPEPEEIWNLTLKEAIRIGLENSEVVRIIPIGAQEIPVGGFGPAPLPEDREIFITQTKTDLPPESFKAAIMAHVRSIEQQYWSLSQQQIALWSRETAVRLGEEILRRERAELEVGRATAADIAEAEQQLENFKLNLVTATSDLITTERQLRNILGLPASDNRRIIPNTAPTEVKFEPNWNVSLAQMIASQPDIAQQRKILGDAAVAMILKDNDASRAELNRQREFLRQIFTQTEHSLARFYLGVDASYKQYETAKRLRDAARKRLEAQQAFYKEDRVTIDRLLDAVSQYANATMQESLYLTTYNSAIAAYEEAKGTLLGTDRIMIVESVPQRNIKQPESAKVDKVVQARFEDNPAPATITPTTYKVRARFGGMQVLEVEVEVNKGKAPATGR